jgi:small nuclear ribonucleoprotein (snRNP)-like protein
MPDTFAITIIFIILSTVVAAFVRRKSRDKCLKDYLHDLVTLEETTGKIIRGKLRVENTGLEFTYPTNHKDENGHDETSYILYKYEYSNIQALIRYHDELSEGAKKEREKELKRTYHPRALRKLKRKIQNVFKTVKDSVMEVVNLLISQAKRTTPAGAVLTSQDKHISQIKKEFMGSVGTSFEPLLERYIGHRVMLELIKGEKISKYSGVLKDYTAEFIEIMDIDYTVKEDQPARKADLVVPRKYGVIRHLGE